MIYIIMQNLEIEKIGISILFKQIITRDKSLTISHIESFLYAL